MTENTIGKMEANPYSILGFIEYKYIFYVVIIIVIGLLIIIIIVLSRNWIDGKYCDDKTTLPLMVFGLGAAALVTSKTLSYMK